MTRTAAPIQRPVRWSSGRALSTDCKQLFMPDIDLPGGHRRPEHVSAQLASRGSSPV